MNRKNSDKNPKIVILGGGFAGVFAYRTLAKELSFDKKNTPKITFVSKNDSFLFVPLTHEVATGNLLPTSLVQPLRTIAPRCRFMEGEVMKVDAKNQKVKVRNIQYHKNKQERAEPEVEIPYDFLVVALGAKTNFHNTPGAEKYSLPLYDLTDAKRIKNQIIESFEKAGYLKNETAIKRALTFVVVGGGPTGVELAAEIADLVFNEIRNNFPSLSKHAKVVLIHNGNYLLPRAERWFHINALKILERLKVRVLLSSKVKEVTERSIELDGENIPTENVFWTAGVEAREIPVSTDKKIEKDLKTKRIKVNEFLQIPEIPNVFVAGDMAYICNKEEKQPYPMRAQFAVREGIIAGQNIKRVLENKPLKEFQWKDLGFIVSLGRKNAVAKLFGVKFKGRPAWFAYRSAYFLKVIGLKAKVRTAVEWTMNLFLPRDVSKF